jgi:hypothetical protein
MLYFSYGSNINPSIMKKYRPNVKIVGKGILYDYDIDFRKKYATIYRKNKSYVLGIVWKLNNVKELENLDIQEMVFSGLYSRIYVDIFLENNTKEKCFTYIMETSPDNSIPTAKYINIIVDGLKKYNFPKNYIEKILKLYNKKFSR